MNLVKCVHETDDRSDLNKQRPFKRTNRFAHILLVERPGGIWKARTDPFLLKGIHHYCSFVCLLFIGGTQAPFARVEHKLRSRGFQPHYVDGAFGTHPVQKPKPSINKNTRTRKQTPGKTKQATQIETQTGKTYLGRPQQKEGRTHPGRG